MSRSRCRRPRHGQGSWTTAAESSPTSLAPTGTASRSSRRRSIRSTPMRWRHPGVRACSTGCAEFARRPYHAVGIDADRGVDVGAPVRRRFARCRCRGARTAAESGGEAVEHRLASDRHRRASSSTRTNCGSAKLAAESGRRQPANPLPLRAGKRPPLGPIAATAQTARPDRRLGQFRRRHAFAGHGVRRDPPGPTPDSRLVSATSGGGSGYAACSR